MLGVSTYPRTFKEHREWVGDILRRDSTQIILDTNILAMPFRLYDDARADLFSWLEHFKRQDRLWIPAWAAHEFVNKVVRNKLPEYLPAHNLPDAVQRLQTQIDLAKRAIDDASAIASVESGMKALSEAAKTVNKSHNLNPDKARSIHADLVTLVSDRVWPTSIGQLVRTHHPEEAARLKARLPPGWRDAGKPENAAGDVYLWLEIEQWVERRGDVEAIVLLSEDQKPDWVYAPHKRMDVIRQSERRPVANKKPTVKIADPRLKHDLQAASGGTVKAFEVYTIEAAVSGWTTRHRELHALAAALQAESHSSFHSVGAGVDVSDNITPTTTDAEASSARANESASVSNEHRNPLALDDGAHDDDSIGNLATVDSEPLEEAAPPHGPYSAAAIKDSTFDPAKEAVEAVRVLDGLMTYNWHHQNPAAFAMPDLFSVPVSPDMLFVIGRNIYQAACGGSFGALALLNHFTWRTARFTPESTQHLLSGMLFEVFFDGSGVFRESFKVGALDELAELLNTVPGEAAVRFVDDELQRANVPPLARMIPLEQVDCELQFETTANAEDVRLRWVKSIAVSGSTILHGTCPPYALHSEETLRELIAETTSIPMNRLKFVNNAEPVTMEGYIVPGQWSRGETRFPHAEASK